MHDIDRTQRELESETHGFEAEHTHEHEGEAVLRSLFHEAEQEYEAESEAGAHASESEYEYESEHEHEHEHELEAESTLSESQEMELASELLEVSNEAELDQFLFKLAKSALSKARSFVRSPAGRMLGGMLKSFAKKALPIAGTAVGGFFGGPIGAKLGGGLGRVATNLFELELEGLSHEDREMEVARQYVRLGAAAMNRASRMSRVPPRLAAQRAFTAAARVYAPGVLRRAGACPVCSSRAGHAHRHGHRTANGSRGGYAGGNGGYGATTQNYPESTYADVAAASSGRWVRRGRKVVLLGI